MRGARRGGAFALLIVVVLASGLLVACGSGSSGEGSAQFSGETDSPLLGFGEEGNEGELEEGAAAVRQFLSARAAGDWSAACAQLARPMLDKIEHLATSATDLEDTSCPSFLGTYTRLSPKQKSESKVVDAGSLREQGQRGFLIYHGAGKVVYAMPLDQEGGAWKVASLSPNRLS